MITRTSLTIFNTWLKVKEEVHHHSVQLELRAGVTNHLQLYALINSSTYKLLIKADSSTLPSKRINGGSSS